MKHRWRIAGRSAIHDVIHLRNIRRDDGDVKTSYTVSFVCTTCGIHWNSWAHFIDGRWVKSKEINHGEDLRHFPVIGRECDPFWEMHFLDLDS
jgi:hypothetical protein